MERHQRVHGTNKLARARDTVERQVRPGSEGAGWGLCTGWQPTPPGGTNTGTAVSGPSGPLLHDLAPAKFKVQPGVPHQPRPGHMPHCWSSLQPLDPNIIWIPQKGKGWSPNWQMATTSAVGASALTGNIKANKKHSTGIIQSWSERETTAPEPSTDNRTRFWGSVLYQTCSASQKKSAVISHTFHFLLKRRRYR